jgi:hypothetical protein
MAENEADVLRRHVKCLILEIHETERGRSNQQDALYS